MNRSNLLSVLAALALAGSAAHAQPGPSPAPARPEVASRGTMSVKEMQEQADQKVSAMRDAVRESFDALKQAREKADVQQIECINGALTAIKGLVKLAEQNYNSLQDAAAKSEAEAVEHEFAKIAAVSDKVSDLHAQLKSCSGPDTSGEIDGKPKQEITVDGEPPQDEYADWLRETEVVLAVPSTTSPYF